MIIIAKFIGKDSLGYENGGIYFLEIAKGLKNDIIIRDTNNRGKFCPYDSITAFLKNWTDIRQYEKENC